MKKVLFFTNMPSPYRVQFFNLLGEKCDLHVIFERSVANWRDASWLSNAYKNFTPHFLKNHARTKKGSFSPDVIKKYKKLRPDITIVCDISSASGILLLSHLIRKKQSYCIEGDGAFDEDCPFYKAHLKKRFFKHADKLLYTSEAHRNYYLRFGARQDQLLWYPFSSVLDSQIILESEAIKLRAEKSANDPFIFVSVGRFLDWKNFETAIKAFGKANIPNSRFVLIGGTPLPSYTKIIEENHINNVTFLPFMQQDKLFDFMKHADCFVFPSKHDIWGLVINEAAANGLPIIASVGTLSAVEISKHTDGIILFDTMDVDQLSKAMIEMINKKDLTPYSLSNIHAAHRYTIEAMAKAHIEIFELNK